MRRTNGGLLAKVLALLGPCLALATVAGPAGGQTMDSTSMTASIAAEREGPHDAFDNVDLRRDVEEYLAPVRRSLGLDLVFNFDIRFTDGAGTFQASSTCSGQRRYVLFVDLAFYDELLGLGQRALEFVLAHELSHFLQYRANPNIVDAICRRRRFDVRTLELMADFAAGYAIEVMYAGRNEFSLLRTVSQLADYEFADVLHHGTVTERTSAFGFGRHARFFGKPLDMRRLLANRATFERLLFAGRFTTSASAQTRMYRNAIEELYR